jgi:hypothetical protein
MSGWRSLPAFLPETATGRNLNVKIWSVDLFELHSCHAAASSDSIAGDSVPFPGLAAVRTYSSR